MKKTLLISGVLLALTATVASAAGINLSWNDCGTFGALNKTFACASNSGTQIITASYDPPAGLTKVSGLNLILDLQTLNTITSTSWWDMFNPGTCRLSALAENISFTTGNCNDYFNNGGSGGITAYITTGTNRRRIGGSWSQAEAALGPVGAGTETYAVNVLISNGGTIGTCNPGCSEPACIVLNEILISQPVGEPLGSPVVNSPLLRNWVTWQGGNISAPGCPAATPTINRTWGQVKSIYR